MKKLSLLAFPLLTAQLLLTGCETIPVTRDISIPEAEPVGTSPAANQQIQLANQLYQQGKKREAAVAYFQAGEMSRTPERERLMLQAIEVAAMLPDKQLMNQYFDAIPTANLDKNNRARYDYTKALLALLDNQPQFALDILPNDISGLAKGLGNKILITRLRAAEKTGNKFAIILERVRQDGYLQTERNRNHNRQQIWQHIGKLSPTEIDQQRRATNDRNLRGWLDLAHLKNISKDQETLTNNLNNWRKNFPNHPARSISDTLGSTEQGDPTLSMAGSTGKAVGVLLPLTGRYASIGNELFQGIEDAHKRLSPGTPLFKHDTSNLDATVVYNQTLQQGTGFVLGPFQKENIVSMSRNGYLPVPALSLNYLPAASRTPENMLQIGLLPEDEAQQIAKFASSKGQKRALVMVPESNWGQRLEKAFSETFNSNNGTIAKVVRYPNRATNYSNEVAKLMKGATSADMIFLAASPTQARSIYPAITQDSSTPIPTVYATSHIYSGRPSPSLDNNLNGIIYTEIPYILDAQENTGRKYPRLYALGQDAFLISRKLNELKLGRSISGKTGKISYSGDGRLHRTLPWATFKDGSVVPYAP